MSCFDPALVSCPLWSLIGGGKSEGGKEQICSVPTCSKPAPLTCSACQAAHYCSRWVLRLKLCCQGTITPPGTTRRPTGPDTSQAAPRLPFAVPRLAVDTWWPRETSLKAISYSRNHHLLQVLPSCSDGTYIKNRSQTVHSSSLPWLQQTCLPAWS